MATSDPLADGQVDGMGRGASQAVVLGEARLVHVAWLGPYGVVPGGLDVESQPHWHPLFKLRWLEDEPTVDVDLTFSNNTEESPTHGKS